MFDRWLGRPWADWILAIGTAISGWLIGGSDGESFLAKVALTARSDLYQTLTNIAAGLLGFYIATVAILLGLYTDRPRMKAALADGRRHRVQSFFFAGIRAVALVLVAFLVVLVLDKELDAPTWIEPVLLIGATLIALRTLRIIWLLNIIVGVAAQDESEEI